MYISTQNTHYNIMKIYICDDEKIINDIKFSKNNIALCGNKINSCIGCFNCWVKHPMVCSHKNDVISNMCEKIIKSDEIIIITKIRNGCYSANVKKILERIIGSVQPFFTIREGEIHHRTRKDEKIKLTIWIYGDFTTLEEEIFKCLCTRNEINLNCEKTVMKYFSNTDEIREVLVIDNIC